MKTLGRWVITVCVWVVTGVIVSAIASHWVGHLVASMVFIGWYFVCLSMVKRLMGKSSDRSVSTRPPRRDDSRGPVGYPKPPVTPSKPKTAPKFNPNQRIYGTAGGAIGGSVAFSDENKKAGVIGEGKTGAILDPLIASSNAYLWHGIWWPGSQNSDIDHVIAFVKRDPGGSAVLYLLCIDSKQWKRGDWSFDGLNTYRDGEFAHEVKMSNAVAAMQKMYSTSAMPCVAFGLVVIHGANSATNNVGPNENTRIITAKGLRDEVRGFLKGSANPPLWACERMTSELKMSEKRTYAEAHRYA